MIRHLRWFCEGKKTLEMPASRCFKTRAQTKSLESKEEFRVKSKRTEKQRRRKSRILTKQRRIERRLGARNWTDQSAPMFSARNIQYEVSERKRGLSQGGIGLIHRMVHALDLPSLINSRLHLLKRHLPYWESDHVLNIAYNALLGGTCLDDIELRRNDEGFLDALGAESIPDPTTAGDFCRRFDSAAVDVLLDVLNEARTRVWAQQPEEFFDEAVLDADGSLTPTTGECKEGMDISYDGTWGYHPLLISLANTREPLYLLNRSGNRPSHEGAGEYFDKAIDLCKEAGFRKVALRGDTDFTQTYHLDGWDDDGVEFVFGFDAIRKVREMAEKLPESAWREMARPPKYRVKTKSRARPENVKDRIVREREYKSIRLDSEDVAEFDYQPGNCDRTYRMVVTRKNLTVSRGEKEFFDDIRYFFYITNRKADAGKIVLFANKRCEQENLIEQLKNGVRALGNPVDSLVSNWAYMVMASLAWSLKAWCALSLPATGRWREKHQAENKSLLRMEFKRFLNAFVNVPVEIVRTGRRVVFRLLAWNPLQHVFLRAVERFEGPLRC